MVKICKMYRGLDVVMWLCPHAVAELVADGWEVREWRVGPYPLDCEINHAHTSGWCEPPPVSLAVVMPAPPLPPLERDAPAGADRRRDGSYNWPPREAPRSHPIVRDLRLRRLMELRRAGVPLGAAIETVEKEHAQ